MALTSAEGIYIHEAIHTPSTQHVIVAGKKWPVITKENKGVKVREVRQTTIQLT
jgi:hypothetical protein